MQMPLRLVRPNRPCELQHCSSRPNSSSGLSAPMSDSRMAEPFANRSRIGVVEGVPGLASTLPLDAEPH